MIISRPDVILFWSNKKPSSEPALMYNGTSHWENKEKLHRQRQIVVAFAQCLRGVVGMYSSRRPIERSIDTPKGTLSSSDVLLLEVHPKAATDALNVMTNKPDWCPRRRKDAKRSLFSC
jgi:hypothetical protein